MIRIYNLNFIYHRHHFLILIEINHSYLLKFIIFLMVMIDILLKIILITPKINYLLIITKGLAIKTFINKKGFEEVTIKLNFTKRIFIDH